MTQVSVGRDSMRLASSGRLPACSRCGTSNKILFSADGQSSEGQGPAQARISAAESSKPLLVRKQSTGAAEEGGKHEGTAERVESESAAVTVVGQLMSSPDPDLFFSKRSIRRSRNSSCPWC